MININLSIIESMLTRTYREDELRIGMFISAVAKKSIEIVEQQPVSLQQFATEASDLTAQWIKRAGMGWKLIFISDPFKTQRQLTRAFAAKWSLDPLFITAMG